MKFRFNHADRSPETYKGKILDEVTVCHNCIHRFFQEYFEKTIKQIPYVQVFTLRYVLSFLCCLYNSPGLLLPKVPETLLFHRLVHRVSDVSNFNLYKLGYFLTFKLPNCTSFLRLPGFLNQP